MYGGDHNIYDSKYVKVIPVIQMFMYGENLLEAEPNLEL